MEELDPWVPGTWESRERERVGGILQRMKSRDGHEQETRASSGGAPSLHADVRRVTDASMPSVNLSILSGLLLANQSNRPTQDRTRPLRRFLHTWKLVLC